MSSFHELEVSRERCRARRRESEKDLVVEADVEQRARDLVVEADIKQDVELPRVRDVEQVLIGSIEEFRVGKHRSNYRLRHIVYQTAIDNLL